MSSSYTGVFYADLPNAYKTTNQWVGVSYGICAKYLIEAKDPTALVNKTGTMNTTFVGTSANIVIKDTNYSDAASFKTAVTGTYIDVKAATPTTEQGTSFPENIEVNDYGMMYWLDTDNNLVSIPQGCKVFYPADYVLWLDTAYGATNGDATDIALKSEISDSALAERGYKPIYPLDSSDFGTITATELVENALYKNVVAIVDNISPGDIVFVFGSNGNVYPCQNDGNTLTIYCDQDLPFDNVTIQGGYKIEGGA